MRMNHAGVFAKAFPWMKYMAIKANMISNNQCSRYKSRCSGVLDFFDHLRGRGVLTSEDMLHIERIYSALYCIAREWTETEDINKKSALVREAERFYLRFEETRVDLFNKLKPALDYSHKEDPFFREDYEYDDNCNV